VSKYPQDAKKLTVRQAIY